MANQHLVVATEECIPLRHTEGKGMTRRRKTMKRRIRNKMGLSAPVRMMFGILKALKLW